MPAGTQTCAALLTNASREGARYAEIHVSPVVISNVTYSNATSNVSSIVTAAMGGQQLNSQSIQVFCSDSVGNNLGTWTNATAGQSICVQITGNYVPVIAKFLYFSTSIPVTVQSVMRAESN
jgi:hypothetical protein